MWYRRMIAGILIGVGFFGSVPWAEGHPVTWEFAGEVTFLDDDDNLLGGAVELGDPFSGSFTFESTTPDANPRDARIGLYEDAILALSGFVAEVPFTGVLGGRTNFIRVVSPSAPIGSDSYFVHLDVDFAGETLDVGLFLLGDVTIFSDDSLPLFPPDLELFTGSYDTTDFSILDGSEVIPFTVAGPLTSLTPEPTTLLLLAAGVLLTGRRLRRVVPQRGPMRAPTGFARHTPVIAYALVALSLLPATGASVRAGDCNGNGIEDSLELAECPAIGVVFLMDTSRSMRDSDYISNSCREITQALAELRGAGLTVDDEILLIGPGGEQCTCCATPPNNTVASRYGTTAPGLCDGEELETCGGTDEGDLEDWGVAVPVVAANKNWGPGPRLRNRTASS